MKLVNLKNNFDFFFLRYRNFLLTCGVEFFLLVLAFCFVFFIFIFLAEWLFCFLLFSFLWCRLESLDKFRRKHQKEKISRFCPYGTLNSILLNEMDRPKLS